MRHIWFYVASMCKTQELNPGTIPRLTRFFLVKGIKMDFDSKAGSNKPYWFKPMLLGVSLHFAWVYVLFYSNESTPVSLNGMATSMLQIVFWGSGLFLALTLAIFLGPTSQALRLSQTKPMLIGIPAIVCAGTLLTFLSTGRPDFGNATSFFLFMVGSALPGIGSAVLACRWVDVFSRERMGVILLHSLPLVACVIAIVETTSYLPEIAGQAITAVLPAVSSYMLEKAGELPSERDIDRHVGAVPHASDKNNRTTENHSPKSRSFLLLLYGCVFILGGVPAYITASPTPSPIAYDALFCMAATFGVLILVCVYIGLFHKRDLPIAAALPLGIVVCVFIPSATIPGTSPLYAFLPVGYICLEALLFLLALVCSKKTGSSAIRTYAASRLFYITADALGWGIGTHVSFDAQGSAVINISLVLMGCTITLIAEMLLILASSSGFFTRRKAGEESASEPATSDGGFSTSALADDFAKTHGLTPREEEVLHCLLHGHSQQRIQEELCISKGTASFHIQNPYAKCNVHSRQELIKLHEQETE